VVLQVSSMSKDALGSGPWSSWRVRVLDMKTALFDPNAREPSKMYTPHKHLFDLSVLHIGLCTRFMCSFGISPPEQSILRVVGAQSHELRTPELRCSGVLVWHVRPLRFRSHRASLQMQVALCKSSKVTRSIAHRR
jgi:hypothetical protein